MNKWFVIIGLIIFFGLIAGGAFVYVIATGKNVQNTVTEEPVGDPFGTDSIRINTQTPQTEDIASPTLGISGSAVLRQVSARKVAGAVLVSGDLGSTIRYAEAGTGHLFELSLATWSETRISNRTLPQTVRVVWSPQGSRAAITTLEGNRFETHIGTIEKTDDGGQSFESDILPEGSSSHAFSTTGDTFFYTLPSAVGTRGIARNLKTGKETTVFEIPLREVTVSWEPEILITTKASGKLTGYGYRSNLESAATPSLALRLREDGQGMLRTGVRGNTVFSEYIGTTTRTLPRATIADKCALTSTEVVCAVPKQINVSQFPEEWYQGRTSTEDTLYAFNRIDGAERLIVDPLIETRRTLDVAIFEPTGDDTKLPFIAKNDRSLWLLTQ